MIGPHYILIWCTPVEGIRSMYFSDSDEGRAALKASLAVLAGNANVYFYRIYCEDTIAIVDMLAPKPA